MAGPRRKKSLAGSRPVIFKQPGASLSAKATRTLIRSHHKLQKSLKRAEDEGDAQSVKALSDQIQEQGGLQSYQAASIIGQSLNRGGDSSKVLIDWLMPALRESQGEHRYRVLEVGALSVNNFISKIEKFDVTRIDLHSQHPDIARQDFMTLTVPKNDKQRYDILSLSLVLNYVPDSAGRGEMLKRTCRFLQARTAITTLEHTAQAPLDANFPCLFLVLPAPCVTNSRYLNEDRLGEIMQSLGYRLARRKLTAKLVYYLWHYQQGMKRSEAFFSKKEVFPGKNRNNFCVVLDKKQDDYLFRLDLRSSNLNHVQGSTSPSAR